MNDLINEPNASRLIYGLRDTGYNFKTAAADIIDNSIAAMASQIHVEIALLSNGRKFVYFGDNGCGMDAEGIRMAMRYGAPERETPDSLGKFGLGLKTASSSICEKFSLISRKNANQILEKLSWDLGHVKKQEKWEMLKDPVADSEHETFNDLCGDKGTLVIWEKCDRILTKDYEAGSSNEKAAISRLSESLSKHLSLVFHRFLDKNDKQERDIEIFVNQTLVEPWDPFYKARSDQVLPENKQKLLVEMPDGSEQIANIRAWILPHRNDMTKEEEKTFARISNRAQGFYIYREGRLIEHGSWMDVFGANEPHTSLLRIEFDFDHNLDDAFRIDVKKSRVLFHPDLEEGLRNLLQPIYREAGNRFRRRSRELANSQKIDHSSSTKNISDATSALKPEIKSVDTETQSAIISNNRGPRIKLKITVQNNVSPETIYVEAVESITTGALWEPAFRSKSGSGHVPAVLLNKHHDFYQKIYKRLVGNGFAVEGMDLLLWAFSTAEQNNTNPELEPIFLDMRTEISNNLNKLLRHVSDPEPGELMSEED